MKRLSGCSLPISLLCVSILYSFSGPGDRMTEQLINLVAVCVVVLAVQLILWAALWHPCRGSRFAGKLSDRGGMLSSKSCRSVLVFWLLFSFAAAPYIGVLSTLTMGLIWILLQPAAFLFLLIRRWREKWISARNYAGLVHVCLGQILGLIVYAAVYRTSLFRKIFFYDEGEVPELEFFTYADASAFGYLLYSFVQILLILLVPVIVYLFCVLIRSLRKRSRKG